MKRLLIVLAIAVFGFSAFAQKQNNPIRFGIAGGLNNSSLAAVESLFLFRDMSIGAQIDISPLISIRPLLSFYSKTEKETNLLQSYPEYTSNTLLSIGGQIDVPFNVLRFNDANIYTGPSIMYINYTTKDYTQVSATTTYLNRDSISNIFGIGAIIGGQYNISKKFSVYLNFGLSYVNTSTQTKTYNALGTVTNNFKYNNNSVLFTGSTIGAIYYIN
jgi:hypothetical protein